MEAQPKDTSDFIETHGQHKQMLEEANLLDSIEEVVCSIAACTSACRNAQGRSLVCHLRQRLEALDSEPARPTTLAREKPPRVEHQPAAADDSMAVDEGVHRRFPIPEYSGTKMSYREMEPPARSAPVHHGQPSAAFAPTVHHAWPPAVSTQSIHRTHGLVEVRVEMDDQSTTVTSLAARPPALSPGASNRFALVNEFPSVEGLSGPLSQIVGDTPSEHFEVEAWLTHLKWENKNLPDQAVATKQRPQKQVEQIRKLKRTVRVICELIFE